MPPPPLPEPPHQPQGDLQPVLNAQASRAQEATIRNEARRNERRIITVHLPAQLASILDSGPARTENCAMQGKRSGARSLFSSSPDPDRLKSNRTEHAHNTDKNDCAASRGQARDSAPD